MPSLISLDIETTGLDPNQEAVIEIELFALTSIASKRNTAS